MTFTYEEEQQIIQMKRNGMSTNNIGKELRCHKSYIVAVLKKYNIPYGVRHITPEEAQAIASAYQADTNGPSIAKRFHTTPTAVYAALERLGIPRRPSNNGFVGDCDHSFFDRIDTEAKAYFLGAMGGDGNVSRTNEISFSLKESDAALVYDFRDALQIGNDVRFDERTKVFRGYRFRYRRAVVSVGSPRLAVALARYGVIPGKTGHSVPALIPQQVPRRLERHYWRGWVDTDGWLFPNLSSDAVPGKRRQLVLGLTGDRPVVKAFRQFCLRHVPSRARIHPNHNIKRFVLTDSFAARMASILYDDATVFLERKHARYVSWKAGRPDWM